MSRIRANKITNQLADGSPTVEKGLIVSGVTTVTTLDLNGDLDVDGHLNADNVSIAGVVTATSFVGSGANLTSLPTQVTIANNADNRVITGGSGVNLNGEANLTYNGTKLSLTGNSASPIVEFINSSGAATQGAVLKLRASGRGGGIDDEDILLITNNSDTRTFGVSNAGTVNTTGDIKMATGKGINSSGIVTATSFSGSGANLTGISAAASYNAIINGEMLVSQRATDFTSVTSSGYHLDRWYFYYQNSSAAFRIRHSGDSPDGFHQSYRVNCTTADTSIASNEEVKLFHKIEGFNLAPFAKGTSGAKRFTLSFYVKCNKSGTYIVELHDRDNNRDVSGSYTVSNTNWNRYTIDFPADTTGEFGFDNGSSLEIQFWLVAGSAVQGGTLNTAWRGSTDPSSATGQVNFTDSTSNEWMLTGVQLEPTTTGTASDFKHEDISTTLLKCKRYYQRSTDSNRGTNYTLAVSSWYAGDGVHSFSKHNSYYDFTERFEVEMRASPTLTIYGSTNQGDIHIEQVAVGSQQVDWNNNTTEVRTKGFFLRHIEDSYGTSGSGNGFGILAYTVDAEL
jgi:hypothetical protein